MNITPEFRTSKEWKKYKRALNHPAAMEIYVNLGCELEGITRKSKSSEGYFETSDLDDLIIMAEADQYPDIKPEKLEAALIDSGIMVKDKSNGYRMLSWERENAKLISSRSNGYKGGRKRKATEPNITDETEDNVTDETERNSTEHTKRNVTELNGTDGLPHGKPTVTPRFENSDDIEEDVPF